MANDLDHFCLLNVNKRSEHTDFSCGFFKKVENFDHAQY